MYKFIIALESTDAKVDQYCLIVVVNHYVFRLDVPVENLRDVVAVVKGFQHVSQVVAHLGDWEADFGGPFVIFLFEEVMEAAFGEPLGDDVDVVFFGIVYYLV